MTDMGWKTDEVAVKSLYTVVKPSTLVHVLDPQHHSATVLATLLCGGWFIGPALC